MRNQILLDRAIDATVPRTTFLGAEAANEIFPELTVA